MAEQVDILIIGGGPIGMACGIEALGAGKSYVIIEKGCLVNSLYNYPSNMTFFSTSERLEIGGVPFTCLHPKPNRAEALEYYRRVAVVFNLNLRLFESVEDVKRVSSGFFEVTSSKQQYVAQKVIVATGFYDEPVRMQVPGETLPKVTHYYKDPHFYAFQQVLVVGGNNSAVDAALETWRKGAHVNMVMKDEQVGERVKYWVRPDIVNRIEEGSIRAFANSTLAAIREYEVDIATPQGIVTIPNDFVIAMTGYKPNFSLLEKMGVVLSKDEKQYPTYHPETMESNVPGLYLAGVVCGGMDTHIWFIENSREHAVQIMKHILAQA
ncbi:MAG TPA: YpdA family putative bacillithiol disulfide reductase [Phnomibacter sp.]|nr:YpdA family putative bacillithiol disulfide reductase [Phnomibacter sp.]